MPLVLTSLHTFELVVGKLSVISGRNGRYHLSPHCSKPGANKI